MENILILFKQPIIFGPSEYQFILLVSPITSLFDTSAQNNPWKAFDFCYNRKILSKKFWSQGTPLGSMGSLSLKRSIVLTSLLQWICRFSWENQLILTKFLWWWTSNLNTNHISVDTEQWHHIYSKDMKWYVSHVT